LNSEAQKQPARWNSSEQAVNLLRIIQLQRELHSQRNVEASRAQISSMTPSRLSTRLTRKMKLEDKISSQSCKFEVWSNFLLVMKLIRKERLKRKLNQKLKINEECVPAANLNFQN